MSERDVGEIPWEFLCSTVAYHMGTHIGKTQRVLTPGKDKKYLPADLRGSFQEESCCKLPYTC